MSDSQPQVIVVNPAQSESSQSSGSPENLENERAEAMAVGQLIESNRQLLDQVQAQALRVEQLQQERQQDQTEIRALSGQVGELVSAIRAAAAEEEEEPEVVAVVPAVEPEPVKEEEAEPQRVPSTWERICDKINSL